MFERQSIPLKHGLILAVLHGSQATGRASEASDWDVAVLGEDVLGRDKRAALRREFAAKLGVPEEKLDISDLRSDAPVLRYRVAMQGKLLDGDMRDFRRFQIAAWKDYLNNEKFYRGRSAFLEKALS